MEYNLMNGSRPKPLDMTVESLQDSFVATHYLMALRIVEDYKETSEYKARVGTLESYEISVFDRTLVKKTFKKILGEDLHNMFSTQLLLNWDSDGGKDKKLCEELIGPEKVEWVEYTYSINWESSPML